MGWSYNVDHLALALDAQPPGDPTPFHGVSTDTRTLRDGEVYFALSGENFDGHDFVEQALEKGAPAVVVSEDCPGGASIVVPDTLEALQRFATYHRKRYDIPVIAVTGSCGKTTTKELIAALLATKFNVVKTKGNLNNEIGCPLSVLQIDGDSEIAVIEVGANHPKEIEMLCDVARPNESAITMIGPSHLEGFGTIEDVANAKAEIMEALAPTDTFYVNSDDARCVAIGNRFLGKTIGFGYNGDVRLESCTFVDGDMVIRIDPIGELRLPLAVKAHAMNVALAVAIALEHGITEFQEPLRDACASLTRCRILNIGPLEVIDDTYNANPASMAAALEALSDRPSTGARIAALGGMGELGEGSAELHRETGRLIAQRGVSHLFVRGENTDLMAEAAEAGGTAHTEMIDDHESMAKAIWASAQPGDVLLVKGSRSMRMERVIEELRVLSGEHSGVGGGAS